jgi:hypothetical protein
MQSRFPGVALDSPEPSRLFAQYSRWFEIYYAIRPAIYLPALLAAVLSLYARGWLCAAPMLVHSANVLQHVGLTLVHAG